MAYPQTSDFTSPLPESAWWENRATHEICSGVGTGLIASMQLVLRSALRPPWRGPNGETHEKRPVVDGTWGPETNAAIWAYAGMRGQSATRGTLAIDAQRKQISKASTRLAIWLTFYAKRHVDLKEGIVDIVRNDPAILGETTLENIQLPEDVKLWAWLQRPNVPGDLNALGAQLPVCRSKTQGGDIGPGGVVPPIGPGTSPPTPAPPVQPKPAESSDSGWGWLVAVGLVLAGAAALRKKRR